MASYLPPPERTGDGERAPLPPAAAALRTQLADAALAARAEAEPERHMQARRPRSRRLSDPHSPKTKHAQLHPVAFARKQHAYQWGESCM
eukprot:3718062-Pleurochrysis_carterae.AAC.1